MKRSLVLVAVALGLAATPARAGEINDPAGFWNILPPGQHGSANSLQGAQFLLEDGASPGSGTRPPHFDDQYGMYRDLLYNSSLANPLGAGEVEDYFKSASFAVPEADRARVERPRTGLEIVRDRFDVPHIYGASAYDVFFGTGYVTGEDRLFVTDVLRHVGRGRLSEFLGASDANLQLDLSIARVAGYSEEELQLQLDLMPLKFGNPGEITVQAIRAFTDGMNAWITEALSDPTKLPAEYPALQVVPKPWRGTDTVAVATLVQALFAAGGGNELDNAATLAALKDRHGATLGRQIYRDMLNREDPDQPVTVPGAFPYQSEGAIDPRAVAPPDPGTFEGSDPLDTLRESLQDMGIPVPGAMSNWLAVNADRAAGGHPIAVMGPQTGYFSPNLLMEIDIHGGGFDARGATFPGISAFVLLGRGIDFAWSAASGGSDVVDVRAELLCEPDGSPPTKDSTAYVLDGICVDMYERTDRWVAKPSAGGIAEPTVITQTVQRTVHGPVIGRALVGGRPVAYARQRSSFFGEVDSAPAFVMLNANMVRDAPSFMEAMNKVTGTFNWLYVDAHDVAYFHSCLCPVRAGGVDHELPVWGTGEWEWRGFLPLEAHPQAINPPADYIVSWNNKPARAWRAADGNYAYSIVYRSQSLSERLADRLSAGGPVAVTEMIDIMEDAATVDLRGSQVAPYALDAIRTDPAGVEPYIALLDDWISDGAHRRAPSAGARYEHEAAIALMDAWYDRLIHAIFDDELDGAYDEIPLGFDDGNRLGHVGSAFQGGYYGHAQKALRMVVGPPVAEPYAAIRCGDGTLAGCRALLRASLLAAVDALPDGGPADWHVKKADEEIRFSAVGVISLPPIDWQNRPTFQQVVQVERRR